MNKIFKVIWSKTKNCWVVVAEIAKSHSKNHCSELNTDGVKRKVKIALRTLFLSFLVSNCLGSSVGYAESCPITVTELNNHGSIVLFDATSILRTAPSQGEDPGGDYNEFKDKYLFRCTSDVTYSWTDYYGYSHTMTFAAGKDYWLTYTGTQNIYGTNYDNNYTNPWTSALVTTKEKEALSVGSTYTAGNGISVSSDNKIYV